MVLIWSVKATSLASLFKLFGWALSCLRSLARHKSDLVLENMALRHQLLLLQRQCPKPKSKPTDRLLWSLLSRYWPHWKNTLLLFRPETVIAWPKSVFRFYWRWRSRPKGGRPRIHPQVAQLIRRMWEANLSWGAPRIRDELAKLGLQVLTATVRKYRPKVCRPSGQTWKTFLLILKAAHRHRLLTRFFDYYHRVRPHRSLDHDAH